MTANAKRTILRLLLFGAALGWGVSFLGVVVPWNVVVAGLSSIGAPDLPEHPLLEYWGRMACASFGFFSSALRKCRIARFGIPRLKYDQPRCVSFDDLLTGGGSIFFRRIALSFFVVAAANISFASASSGCWAATFFAHLIACLFYDLRID